MRYLPPARVGDFQQGQDPEKLSEAWHNRVDGEISGYRHLPRFLDPLDAAATATRAVIPWPGFPRTFESRLDIENHPRRRERAFRSAEMLNRSVPVILVEDGEANQILIPPDFASNIALYPVVNDGLDLTRPMDFAERPQDEYLEWHVVRDQSGRITRIDFTAEAPEYWETLAENDRKLAAELYSDLLKADVPEEDLFFSGPIAQPVFEARDGNITLTHFQRMADIDEGTYNRRNRWNTDLGCVHLTQRANTLFAEINLAARATQIFAVRPDLNADVDRFALTACGGFGAVNRHSDPTIGMRVNSLTLDGHKAMVSNPIGLYIGEVDLRGFRDPQGQPVAQDLIRSVVRGSFADEDGLARVLRFSIHPPEGADYGLERCTLDGEALTTGGPIAQNTTVVIHAVAEASQTPNQNAACEGSLCVHPERMPKQYLAVEPGDACPVLGAEEWDAGPALAPDPLLIAGMNRVTGAGGRNA